MLQPKNTAARVFCSYSHRDDEFRRELEAHLASLARQNLITFWYDRRIVPGDDWRAEIATELNEADIILLLISAYFISSDYCYKIELGRALQRNEDGSAVVIPIFIRPCDREGLPFSSLQGLPTGDKAISEYQNRDSAWALVAKGVREARNTFIERPHLQPTSHPKISDAEIEKYEATAYLRRLTAFHEKKSRAGAFELKADVNGRTQSLANALESWANARFRPLFLLVGEPGSGKTWAFRDLAATLAEGIVRDDRLTPQPIYVPFQALKSGSGIETIYKAVPEAQGVLDKYQQGTNTVLLLDGIDEVTLDSADAGMRVLSEILEGAHPNVGIAVSTRPQVAQNLLAHLEKLGYQFLVCTIRGTDASAIADYFRKAGLKVPTDAAAMLDVRQPAMLKMFGRDILRLWTGSSLELTDLYEAFISVSIRSARERDTRVASVPPETLRSFLTSLAGQMFPSATMNIGALEVGDEWKSRKFDIINGLITSRLLTLSSRELVSFAHLSFFEFFFAKLLFEELSSWNAYHLSRSNLIYSYNINRFLIPLLLDELPRAITPGARRTREQLQKDARNTENCLLTQPILRKHFLDFVDDSGWRRDTGFGQWMSFTDASGKLAASDGALMPERHHILLAGASGDDQTSAVSLSWYDAYQFSRWIGGALPTDVDIPPNPKVYSPEFEWTSSWFSETESLISVRHHSDDSKHGVNPDVRSSNLGFRVKFSEIK